MQTIRFLPDRLNCEPVVFRGFTTSELGLTALAGLAAGLLLSPPVTPLLLIIFGGRWLSRIKRGKPENYIWQRLAEIKCRHHLGSRLLITAARGWSVRRTRTVSIIHQ